MNDNKLQNKYRRLLNKLKNWTKRQKNVRLVLGPPMTNTEIKNIPSMIKRSDIPDKYSPDHLQIPESYREFLLICRSARIEFLEEGVWCPYASFYIYSPDEIAEARAWISAGETMDDEREVSTTEFIAFADGGLHGKPNYWCFYTGKPKRPELPIYFLDNDHEFLIGKYAGSNDWIFSKYKYPAFTDFSGWLKALIEWIIKEPFNENRERNTW